MTRIDERDEVISVRPIVLPSSSGVRPTISPAMNTARTTYTSMLYIPVPTPPGETSPSIMFDSGTAPPRALKLSCIELTAPVDVPVVAPAKIEDQAMPKRCSLPSMHPAAGRPSAAYSAHAASAMLATRRPPIARRRRSPGACRRTISP